MSTQDPVSKARPVYGKAFDALYDAVVRCELEPGSWIRTAELSELLKAGRTPTLQALNRLEAAGFTRPVKRKGWQITPITLNGVRQVFEAFRLAAPGLMVLACRNADDSQLATLRELTLSWAPGQDRRSAEPDLDRRPITYLVEICGNPIVEDMCSGMAAHFERIANFGLRQGQFVNSEYTGWRDRTFEALVRRDEARASDAIIKLTDSCELEIVKILQDADSLRGVPLRMDRARA